MQNYTTNVSIDRAMVSAARSPSNSEVGSAQPPNETADTGNSAQQSEAPVSLVYEAYLRLLAGDVKEARRALERALGSEADDEPPIVNASTAHMQSSQTGQLATNFESRAHGETDASTPPPPIAIKTLGTFEVTVDGTAAGAARKPPHLLLGILKVLIANGGCSVNRSLLLDALWPDLDGDRANDAQQVALHRLRKLLGHSDALVINHGYVSINPQLVEVDAFILDTLCRNPFIQGHQERSKTALDLYRGTFLPDELDSPWSGRMRECMRAKFVNIIAAAGKELELISDFDGAASLYEQALTVDDLEGIIRECLMRVLRRRKSGKVRRSKPN